MRVCVSNYLAGKAFNASDSQCRTTFVGAMGLCDRGSAGYVWPPPQWSVGETMLLMGEEQVISHRIDLDGAATEATA